MTHGERDKFCKGLDINQPDWWYRYANRIDVDEFCRLISIAQRWATEQKGNSIEDIDKAIAKLRRLTADRLEVAVRGAIDGGLAKLVD